MTPTTALAPELIVLVPCVATNKFFDAIIRRGIERSCMRKTTRYRVIRDTMRDCLIREPERLLGAYFGHARSFLVLWDHHGSGATTPEVGEDTVRQRLRKDVPEDNLLAVAIDPELEAILVAVYPRCREWLVHKSQKAGPTDDAILRKTCSILRADHPGNSLPDSIEDAQQRTPKELFKATAILTVGRYSEALVEELAATLSISQFKSMPTFRRVTDWLQAQFPPPLASSS